MPYIKKSARGEIAAGRSPKSPGELNYAITELIKRYLKENGKNPTGYGDINEIVGVLECCKLEFYRRIASPYEDEKIQSNGDVY